MLIATAVSRLAASGRPVMLLDTCSLLDLIRSPARGLAAELPSAVRIASAAEGTPPGCSLAVASVVPGEFADRVAQVRGELTNFLAGLGQTNAPKASVSGYAAACAAVGCSFTLPPAAGDLLARLSGLADRLLAAAVRFDRDDALVLRAYGRCLSKRRPARRGQWKDPVVVEETLSAAAGLRAAGHAGPVLLLSSNVNDYCYGRASPLHADLVADFATDGVQYARDWPEAASVVGL